MNENDRLAERFEEHRNRLTAVAMRMLGSRGEAEDAVQETWLRLSRSDPEAIENLGAWLTTVVSRVCLNVLQARRARPEVLLGADMPEPVADTEGGFDPEYEALLAVLDPDVVMRADPGAAVWMPGGEVSVAFRFAVADGKVTSIDLIGDPDRLAELDLETPFD
jgi:RNA polymerase sigma factor (sigma-70 family)